MTKSTASREGGTRVHARCHAGRPFVCRQVHVQERGGTEVGGDRAGDARAGQQVHVRGPGGRVHRLPDAQPDGGHGAHGVPGGPAVRRPDGAAAGTAAGPVLAAPAGPGHRAAAAGPDARGRGRGRRARRGVRPHGPALRHAAGVLRRVRRPERGPRDDRRERGRAGHGRAPGTVAPRRAGRVQRNGELRPR